MRRPVAWVALLLAVAAASGCAARKPRSLAPSPAARVLPGVPVQDFGVQNCGAGSLSTVLQFHGHPVTLEELEKALPRGRNDGVLTLDMILEARRRGFDARMVEGSFELVEGELLAGRPVILMLRVLDTFGLGYDLYHYVVLDGIDPERGLVRVQLGDQKPRWTTLSRLDSTWRPTQRTALLIAPDPEGPLRAAQNTLRYAVALEAAGRAEEAVSLYRVLLDEQPGSALLWTNLGNALVATEDWAAAEVAYRRALEIAPEHRDALNNLSWLLLEEGELLEEAEALARRAVEVAGPDPWLAMDTLGRVLRARGACEEALATFEAALAAAPPEDSRQGLGGELERTRRDCGPALASPRL